MYSTVCTSYVLGTSYVRGTSYELPCVRVGVSISGLRSPLRRCRGSRPVATAAAGVPWDGPPPQGSPGSSLRTSCATTIGDDADAERGASLRTFHIQSAVDCLHHIPWHWNPPLEAGLFQHALAPSNNSRGAALSSYLLCRPLLTAFLSTAL